MFARTPRLTLRPGWPEDAAALHAAIAHAAVVGKLARVPWPYLPHHASDWLARPADGDHPLLIAAHDLGPAPVLVGGIGLHREREGDGAGGAGGDAAGWELGYWLTPAAWGRGYATEAGRHLVGIARDALGLARLSAYHHADNPASGRVLAKLGFRVVGHGRRWSAGRGAAVDSVLLALDLAAPPLAAAA